MIEMFRDAAIGKIPTPEFFILRRVAYIRILIGIANIAHQCHMIIRANGIRHPIGPIVVRVENLSRNVRTKKEECKQTWSNGHFFLVLFPFSAQIGARLKIDNFFSLCNSKIQRAIDFVPADQKRDSCQEH